VIRVWEWKGMEKIIKMKIVSRGEKGNVFVLIPLS
jgi:hypothetical protein